MTGNRETLRWGEEKGKGRLGGKGKGRIVQPQYVCVPVTKMNRIDVYCKHRLIIKRKKKEV